MRHLAVAILFWLGLIWPIPLHAQSQPMVRSHEETLKIIRVAYQKELERKPDKAGIDAYYGAIQAGLRDLNWLRTELRHSPEYKSKQEGRLAETRKRAMRTAGTFMAIWAGMLAMLWGLGWCVSACLLRSTAGWAKLPNLAQGIGIGFGVLIILLQFWSIFRPIDGFCQIFFWCIGLLAFSVACFCEFRSLSSNTACTSSGRGFWTANKDGKVRLAVFGLALAIAAVTMAAGVAKASVEAYDTLLYHFSSVRWTNTYAAVPGLANLHIRLGTNSAWLLVAALIDNGPFEGRSAWIMPGLAGLFYLTYLLRIVLFHQGPMSRAVVVAWLLIPYGLRFVSESKPSLYFDSAAHFFLAIALTEFLLRKEEWKEATAHPSERRDLNHLAVFTVVLPIVVSFVIKPVAAPFLIVAGLWTVWNLWKNTIERTLTGRSLVTHLLPMLAIAGWMIRNAILTGWLVFPADALALRVDWTVPAAPVDSSPLEVMQSVQGQTQAIKGFARRPGDDHLAAAKESLMEWLPSWYRARWAQVELAVWMPLGIFGLMVWQIRRHQPLNSPGWEVGITSLLVFNLTFWLHTAPDLRFGSVLMAMWCAWGVALALTPDRPRLSPRATAIVTVLVALSLGATNLAKLPGILSGSSWLYGKAASSPVIPQTLDNGQVPPITVYVPTRSDQCGDALLPCTPYPRNSLQARVPGNLAAGFKVVNERP